MGRKKMNLEIVNPNAAGIDVGSRSHFVAKGQLADDVKEFGVCASDHQELIKWLKKYKIKTVAMESTGSYWQNLFSALQEAGFEVLLANGKFTKNIKGKKTDVLDCQWIQKLHSLGLLSGSSLPDKTTEKLRTYCRHRENLIDMAASASKKIQKYLRLMNLRLDIVVKDICGLTGLKIIDAICKGETDGKILASFRHGNCHKSELEISKASQSNGREDYLFALQQEYQMYKELQKKITQCELKIKVSLEQTLKAQPQLKNLKTTDKVHKRINKNAPKSFDLNQVANKYFAWVDLLNIEGIGHNTILTLMSEIGPDGLKKFPSGKHFASWLRLAPNNKISGGKILSSRIPKGSNRLKIALRQAANSIGNMKGANLHNFFIRICIRKGRTAAITATARKLSIIIWNMLVKRVPYNPPNQYEFLDQKRKRKVREMRKLVVNYGILPHEIGFVTI
ncbi:IS110 family transposase [Candidatus Peregrinibacteria bacterium]|nr:IS110 family transposase [Candidatus Peregrinibacteria bacterium]